jgi:hypothetical protein
LAKLAKTCLLQPKYLKVAPEPSDQVKKKQKVIEDGTFVRTLQRTNYKASSTSMKNAKPSDCTIRKAENLTFA